MSNEQKTFLKTVCSIKVSERISRNDLTIASNAGSRSLRITKFFLGPKKCLLRQFSQLKFIKNPMLIT